MLEALLRDFFSSDAPEPSVPSKLERRDGPRVAMDTEATLTWVAGGEGEERSTICRQVIRIRDQSENGVGVLIDPQLRVGQSVRILAPGLDEAGVVRHCRAVGEGYCAGIVLVKHEKRRFERQPHQEPATLRATRSVEGRNQWPVTILDSTPYGVRIRSSVPLPERTCVKVVHADWQCLGSVCYSKPADDAYVAGLYLIGKLFTEDSAEF